MVKRNIPNILTLCNLICGALAVYMASLGALHSAAFFMIGGILFDFVDGFSARLLGVSSPLGKELDSLADVVTSGVAPGIILFQMLMFYDGPIWWAYIAFLMPAFSAYRLAKFNLDTRQSHLFLGLPVPSNGLIWAALGICAIHPDWAQIAVLPVPQIDDILLSKGGLIVMTAVSMLTNVLMISEVPMLSLKFTNYCWKENKLRYLLLIGALILIALFGIFGIAMSILWYILLSLISSRHAE